jgi:DNA polymerase III subunit delta'
MKKVIGNEDKIKLIEKFAGSAKPDGSYIISGPAGTAKKEIAEYFTELLVGGEKLVTNVYKITPEIIKKKSKNKGGKGKKIKLREKEITVGQVRDAINFMNLKSFSSTCMVCIVEKAEKMTPAAQNALLKSLEEPKRGNVFLLVAESAEKLLPTIQSRSAVIKLGLANPKDIFRQLIKEGNKEMIAKEAAYYGWGKIENSRNLAESPWKIKSLQEEEKFFFKLIKSSLFEKLNFLEAKGNSGKIVQEVDSWITFLATGLERKIIGDPLVKNFSKNRELKITFQEAISLLNSLLFLRKKIKYTNVSTRLALEAAFL